MAEEARNDLGMSLIQQPHRSATKIGRKHRGTNNIAKAPGKFVSADILYFVIFSSHLLLGLQSAPFPTGF